MSDTGPYGGLPPIATKPEDGPNRLSPIGVPDDYLPNRNPNGNDYPLDYFGPGSPSERLLSSGQPLYSEGQEFQILGDMTPQQINEIQYRLEGLGVISNYTPGVIDGSTLNGFTNVLGMSNANGQTWQQMLQTIGQAGGIGGGRGGGGGGATRAPLVTRTSNPDTLKRYLRKAVVEMTGSSQSPDIDIDQMVEAYQQIERDYQKQIYDTQLTGGEVVEPPSFDDYAQGQVEGEFGAEVQANSIAERAGGLLKAIAGGRI